MNMDKKAVIFDCDGVLVDTEPLAADVLGEMGRERGWEFDTHRIAMRKRGTHLAKILTEFELLLGESLDTDFEKEFRARCAVRFRRDLDVSNDLISLLSQLRVPICVASSGPRDKIQNNLRYSQLDGFFGQMVFSSFEIGLWKPDPAIFIHAAEAMAVEPENCIVIEDSLPGINAADSARMTPIGFGFSVETRAELARKINTVLATHFDLNNHLLSQYPELF